MVRLEGVKVRLRALEPGDADILYRWENDPQVWEVSETLTPYSRDALHKFIVEQQYDIFRTRQLRLVIVRKTDGEPVGFADLFDFDPLNARAAVGILVYGEDNHRKGYASEALNLLADYASGVLRLHQLYGSVHADNTASINLFRGCGFAETGRRHDWSRGREGWRDEIFFQLILLSV